MSTVTNTPMRWRPGSTSRPSTPTAIPIRIALIQSVTCMVVRSVRVGVHLDAFIPDAINLHVRHAGRTR
jgi:hypothetical protein